MLSLTAYSHLIHPICTSAYENLLAVKTNFQMILFRHQVYSANIMMVYRVRY